MAFKHIGIFGVIVDYFACFMRIVSRFRKVSSLLALVGIGLAFGSEAQGAAAWTSSLGLLYERFDLVLEPGFRREWMGPFYSQEQRGEAYGWAAPPFASWTKDSGTESAELDVLYPLLTYDRFGPETRWQFFQLFSISGGPSLDDSAKKRLSLFPFYFQQRSANPTNQYTAFVPFYGEFKNRFFRDEVRFVLLPLYVQSRKREVVTDNYIYPFFHLRHGGGVAGWQLWPLIGSETKGITQRTNHWGDVEEIPGHKKFFFGWLLYFNERSGIGGTNEDHSFGFAPFFTREHSALRDAVAFPWPLGYRRAEDREKGYKEWSAPWPFITFARGPGKTADRVWPFFSHAKTPEVETGFYLWPLYKTGKVRAAPYERDSSRVLFYLYADLHERNTDTGEDLRRRLFWPLFSYRKDFQGRERLQVLAVLEPFLPTSRSIERNYSPLWSLWRSESNPKTGVSSRSFLWNLYHRERTPDSKKGSLLFGLFQYQTGPDGKHMRLFYIPTTKKRSEAVPAGSSPAPTNPPPQEAAPR